jgi:hypothetical protein
MAKTKEFEGAHYSRGPVLTGQEARDCLDSTYNHYDRHMNENHPVRLIPIRDLECYAGNTDLDLAEIEPGEPAEFSGCDGELLVLRMAIPVNKDQLPIENQK